MSMIYILNLCGYRGYRSLPLLLPAVEDGIFSENWRIRQSSVELLGDLLFKVLYPVLPSTFLISALACSILLIH